MFAELAGIPLVVNDVVKTYGDGFRAVDGVSFGAEPGQVVGLLGPNGAGKTTVIRMLVGLIRPDSGSIYIHGKPVHAGADVLSSVGAFIEGPGFLPHLSGMANLTAYWHATGRPLEEAHLDEALEIAGLGTAINRKVRSYSHGMRQRLGIAQAMLGLPPLLVLDEPTNGLDPPQIKAMRAVLADYTRGRAYGRRLLPPAVGGRTHLQPRRRDGPGQGRPHRRSRGAHGQRHGDADRADQWLRCQCCWPNPASPWSACGA